MVREMRQVMFAVLKKARKFLSGKQISKFSLTQRIYSFLYQLLKPYKGIILTKVQDHQMYVDSKYVKMTKNLIINESWEEFETEIFKREVKEGMKVVDIGAFWGWYTLIAAKLVGKEGKVYAFEPEPHNYSLLTKNIKINGYENVVPMQKAVSNKNGKTKLFLMEGNPGGHTIYSYNSSLQRNFIEVESITLDEFFKDKNEEIDIIKIDAEGAEFAIFQGMRGILEKDNKLKIFMEFWPEGLKRFGYSPRDLLYKLMEQGFKFFYFNEREGKKELVDVNKCIQLCSGKNHIILFQEKNLHFFAKSTFLI